VSLRQVQIAPRDGEPYGRCVLWADAEGEVMLASWRKGAACAPHDHGHAEGMVVVLDGRFTEVAYDAPPHGLLTMRRRAASVGDVVRVPPGLVHEMRAETCGNATPLRASGGLTLHVYVPGIHAMKVYDRATRATLEVADGCGAWVPADLSLIVRRWPWDRPDDVAPGAKANP
jgi:hypothetical protein